jgi:hypothetical protein
MFKVKELVYFPTIGFYIFSVPDPVLGTFFKAAKAINPSRYIFTARLNFLLR